MNPLIEQWKARQEQLRRRLIVAPIAELPRCVAGADVAFSADRRTAFAAAVVYDRIDQRIIEVAHAAQPVAAPYIPGYLSFREGPVLVEAIARLTIEFGAILFDGQGYAHPRRCGLACHVAIELDSPGVGVAKSRLIGTFGPPDAPAGSSSPLMDAGEQIGLVLRTRGRTRPLFVSIGHRIDLPSAARLVLACCTRYRIPEPTRRADIEVARLKRERIGP
jgi:deoxyribonuclease V